MASSRPAADDNAAHSDSAPQPSSETAPTTAFQQQRHTATSTLSCLAIRHSTLHRPSLTNLNSFSSAGCSRPSSRLSLASWNTLLQPDPYRIQACSQTTMHTNFSANYTAASSDLGPTTLTLLNAASTCPRCQTLLNNTFLRTHASFRSLTFLLSLGTELTENQCQSARVKANERGNQMEGNKQDRIIKATLKHLASLARVTLA